MNPNRSTATLTVWFDMDGNGEGSLTVTDENDTETFDLTSNGLVIAGLLLAKLTLDPELATLR